MSKFIAYEIDQNEYVWVEVDDTADTAKIEKASAKNATKTLEQSALSLKKTAEKIISIMEDLSPNEIEVSFGIKAGAEAGNPIFGLAKANGEASYTVTMKWEKGKQKNNETKPV
jgi:hypothetical protein